MADVATDDVGVGDAFTQHLTTVMLVTGPKGKCISSVGAFPLES